MDATLINGLAAQLPHGWHVLDRVGDNGETEYAFSFHNDTAEAIIEAHAIPSAHAMPYGHDSEIIDIIRQNTLAADPNAGLLEVATTTGPVPCVYALFKNRMPDGGPGVHYAGTLYAHYRPGECLRLAAQAVEVGTTGMREASLFPAMLGQGLVTFAADGNTGQSQPVGWSRDPYDPTWTHGFLMNLAEQRQWDKQFPGHPLSVLRGAIDALAAATYTGR